MLTEFATITDCGEMHWLLNHPDIFMKELILFLLLLGMSFVLYKQEEKINKLHASLAESDKKIAAMTEELEKREANQNFVPHPSALQNNARTNSQPASPANRRNDWMWEKTTLDPRKPAR